MAGRLESEIELSLMALIRYFAVVLTGGGYTKQARVMI